MRNVFNALAKIIGVWFVASGIGYWAKGLMSIGRAISLRHAEPVNPTWFPTETSWCSMLHGSLELVNAGLLLFFAWVLIFKTDWVADRVKVPRDEDSYKPPERSALLTVGVQLTGLYLLLETISWVLYNIDPSSAHAWRINNERSLFATAFIAVGLPCIVKICLSVLCILKADAIVAFITAKAHVKWPKILAITLIALGLLIAVTALTYKGMVQ